MYKKNKVNKGGLKGKKSYVGERIEERMKKLLYTNEGVGEGSPLIYTDRRKGVMAETNIRTDRFEIALDAMYGVSKRNLNKRKSYYEIKKDDGPEANKEGVNTTQV